LIKLKRSVTEIPEKNLNFNYLSLFILALKGKAFICVRYSNFIQQGLRSVSEVFKNWSLDFELW
jgi:hypothetical protein